MKNGRNLEMKKASKLRRALPAALVAFTLLAGGCGSVGTNSGTPTPPASSTPGTSTPTPDNREPGRTLFSENPITLTYWAPLDGNAAAVVSSYGEVEIFKEMERLTNIKIDFKHPPAGQEKEQFNLMIAARDLPDFIEYGWGSYPGGPEKAISDQIIIKINDLIDVNSPDFKALLDTDANVSKQARTDDGSLYMFPAVGVGYVKTTTGTFARQDWLTELGLSAPETLDEWTEMLTQFKEKKGAIAPLTGTSNDFDSAVNILGAFGLMRNFYLKDGKVAYGPAEPAYKDALALLRSWYENGLLDPDFASNNAKAVEAKIVGGQSGVLANGGIGGTMGYYLNAMKDQDPKFDLVALQFPVLNKGDEPQFTQRAWEVRTSNQLAITTVNKHPEESARWANYFFTEEGNILKNFGIEGLTFNWEGDFPKYSELITNNPDGLSISNALGKYTRGSTPSPGHIDSRYHEQYFALPQQKAAFELWSKVSDNSLNVLLPPVTATQAETDEASTIITTIDAYQKEMFVKFVMGTESLDNFDAYLAQLEKMNLSRAIELRQAALDRYNQR